MEIIFIIGLFILAFILIGIGLMMRKRTIATDKATGRRHYGGGDSGGSIDGSDGGGGDGGGGDGGGGGGD